MGNEVLQVIQSAAQIVSQQHPHLSFDLVLAQVRAMVIFSALKWALGAFDMSRTYFNDVLAEAEPSPALALGGFMFMMKSRSLSDPAIDIANALTDEMNDTLRAGGLNGDILFALSQASRGTSLEEAFVALETGYRELLNN